MACIAKRRGKLVIDFYDNIGKRRYKTLPKGTTKKRAEELLREIQNDLAKGTYIPEKTIPTFKKVAKDWIQQKTPNIRPTTLKMYRGHLTHHFQDIDPLPINKITIATVEKYINQKQKNKMNISTLRRLITTFNQVMSYAVRHNYTTYNPVRDAERPRRQDSIDAQSIIKILKPDQIQILLKSITDLKIKTLITLAIMTGARQGELLALKWGDIDWQNRQLHIKKTYNNGGWYTPKTKTSNRKIDLGPQTIKALQTWQKDCPANKLNLIFPNKEAVKPLHNGLILKKFQQALKEAGLPKIRFHDLRHTYASLLLNQGDNVKYIQKQLGHATPIQTLNVYSHLVDSTNQTSPKRLENTILLNKSTAIADDFYQKKVAGIE